jgi:imidazolonepropionase-like amidohydrolase
VSVRIEADLLIPGRGEPVPNGAIVIEGATIAYAGPAAAAPAPQATTYRVKTAMPGMWEAHAHFWGTTTAAIEALITLAPQVGALRAAADVERLLLAGFTSARELGGRGPYLQQAIEEGTIRGPHLYASGSVLSQTGGHADLHSLPSPVVDDLFERHFGSPSVCDGPDDCRRLVRRQLRLGAKVIKVCASGGVMSQMDHPIHQQFSKEELSAMVEEAARAERVVAAHCHGKPGIMAALEAGVRTVEHGTYLDEEAARAMVETGALLVPTRFIVEHLVGVGKELAMPDYAYQKIVALAGRHLEAMQIAAAAGVPMALGTDIFISGAVGRNGEEAAHLVRAGLTPRQAIEAATANGPLTVGPQAPLTGQLAAGYDGDVIAVDGDPLADITLLGRPESIPMVWKRGALVKP